MRKFPFVTYLEDPAAQALLFNGKLRDFHGHLSFFFAIKHKFPSFTFIFCFNIKRTTSDLNPISFFLNCLGAGSNQIMCLNEMTLAGEYTLSGKKLFFSKIFLIVSWLKKYVCSISMIGLFSFNNLACR